MPDHDSRLPALPLVLCDVPPGLVLALGQEGVPVVTVSASKYEPSPSLRRGRFVLFDRRLISPERLDAQLAPGQMAIDVDRYRSGQGVDPFAALIDTEGGRSPGGSMVCEWSSRWRGMTRRRFAAPWSIGSGVTWWRPGGSGLG